MDINKKYYLNHITIRVPTIIVGFHLGIAV